MAKVAVEALDDRAGLVVVDVQAVLGDSGPAGDVVARSRELAEAFRTAGLPVMLVRVTAGADGSEFAPGRTDVGFGLGGRPPGWDEVHPDLAGYPGDVVITKRNPGAFVGTDLDQRLRRAGVTQVVVTGVATSLGVESTVRSAFDRGYNVVPVVDAMLDPDLRSHEHSTTRVFPQFGQVARTAQVLELLYARRS